MHASLPVTEVRLRAFWPCRHKIQARRPHPCYARHGLLARHEASNALSKRGALAQRGAERAQLGAQVREAQRVRPACRRLALLGRARELLHALNRRAHLRRLRAARARPPLTRRVVVYSVASPMPPTSNLAGMQPGLAAAALAAQRRRAELGWRRPAAAVRAAVPHPLRRQESAPTRWPPAPGRRARAPPAP